MNLPKFNIFFWHLFCLELELSRRPFQANGKLRFHAFTTVWVMPCHNQIRDFIREDKRLIMNNLHPRWHFVELIALHTEDIETRRSNSYCVGRGSQQRGEVPDHQKRATIWGYRAAQAPRQKEICMGYYTGNNRRRGGTIESSAHAVNLVTAEPRRNFQVKARLPRLHPHFEH